MFGHLFNATILQNIGAITVASPLPLVFTDRWGMEDFASRYFVKWKGASDATGSARISGARRLKSSDFRRLPGPFTRKDVYATAVAYAPRLPETLWRPVLEYGFCRSGPLWTALAVGIPFGSFQLEVATQTAGRSDTWKFDVTCAP